MMEHYEVLGYCVGKVLQLKHCKQLEPVLGGMPVMLCDSKLHSQIQPRQQDLDQ